MKSLYQRIIYEGYPQFLKIKAKLNTAQQKRADRFQKIKQRFYADLWKATANDLDAEILDVGYGYYRLQKGSQFTYVNGSNVMLDTHLTLKMAGNKPLIHQILFEHRFPVVKYKEYDLSSFDKACRFLDTLNKPVVVKPAVSGAAGKGIVTGIDSEKKLKNASQWAAVFGNKLLIEEQVAGNSFRLLYLNGLFIDAIERRPPHVIGNNNRTIRMLIEDENENRLKGEPITSLHPLTVDPEMRYFLESQGYTLNKTVPENERVAVKRAVNQNNFSENISVKKDVHPDTIAMGSQISKLLHVQLAGIDLICKDIAAPLGRENGIVSEVNTTPGLHHHYLISKPQEVTSVATHILKYLIDS